MGRKDQSPQAKRAGGLAERIRGRLARARRGISYTFSVEHLRELFTARSFKAGGYTAVSCVLVIAIAAVAVVVAESLPSTYTTIDISRDQTTSISDETRDYLAELDDDVEIYLIAEEGAQDEYLELLLDDYAAASDRVCVEQVDPTLHPTFTDQYTSDEVADGSLIVVCGDESRVVTSSELYSINYATYSYEFAGESAITGAITALTSEDLPHVYLLSGHGEASLPQTVSSTLESANYETETLSLVSSEKVPDDADAVIMYAPTSDLTDEEHDRLLAYLEDGGSFMLVTSYTFTAESMPNLADVMDAYGMEAAEGVVMEGDLGYTIAGYHYYLLPQINSAEATGDLAGESVYVLFPLAHGIQAIDQYRSSLSVTSLLSTSSSAYLKTDIDNAETLEYEDGDISGQTSVGMAASEDVGDDAQTRVVWYSTDQFLVDEIDLRVGGYNGALFVESLTWLTGVESPTAEIASKGYGTSYLTIADSTASMLSVTFIGIIPGAVLICGLVIWRRRRMR